MKLNSYQQFAIWWCFDKAMRYMDMCGYTIKQRDPTKDLFVDGVNINQTIDDLLLGFNKNQMIQEYIQNDKEQN